MSKNGQDQYINMMSRAAGAKVTNTENFCFDSGNQPIVLRGILKYKIMKQCQQQGRDFYYVDTGYFDHWLSMRRGRSGKLYHRVVKNNLQHQGITPRPADRWRTLGIPLPRRRHGGSIVIAAPDEKPCKFYNINLDDWIKQVCDTVALHTDRPLVIRHRAARRAQRVVTQPLTQLLAEDVHALITFNSTAAIESILSGVPAFVLAPTHAAAPVANKDLDQIETPYWPDQDKLFAWACSLAYQQWHVSELADGSALRHEYHAN